MPTHDASSPSLTPFLPLSIRQAPDKNSAEASTTFGVKGQALQYAGISGCHLLPSDVL